jgi:D-glycero-D-manno-heptose 1,7-bisphosphate phosphatase
MSPSAKSAIFLDRDGTLNESVGYVNHPSRFRLYPWAVEAIRAIRDEGRLAVLVTNQSGVGRGFYGAELVEELHGELQRRLRDAGAELDGVYVCPHRPSEGCGCRKPASGMLLSARDELNVDLERSWLVGDTYTDLQAAWGAGARAALVLTGFGAGTWEHERHGWPRPPDLVAPDVHRAVCSILWGELD